ncbi:glycosyltransferase family 2 protein [Firmicutes bacterium AM41-11]|nr:glycosyltransferase family 2 protein [Firmicutes bacterium AM41-11]
MKKSVALCTYNGEKFIEQQLESILDQTEMIDEIIICDDGSTDNTIQMVQHTLLDKNIDYKLVRNKTNLGFKKNFYQAISLCQGDIIFFCDQDDVWNKNKVKVMTDVFENNPNALLVFSNASVTDAYLQPIDNLFSSLSFQQDFMKNKEVQVQRLLADNFVTGATSAIRKDLITLAKPYPKNWAHDYWFGVISALYNGLFCVNDKLINYRQHSNNTIGVDKGISISLLKRLFSKKKTKGNRDNLYAEIRLEQLEELIKFFDDKEDLSDLYPIILDNYNFWKKRESFSTQGILKNSWIVLKDAMTKQQYKYRNTSKPILIDFVKGIALAHRDA